MLPEAGEKCAQWSSYDRASKYDEKTGKYVAWDANGDDNGCIRKEGKQIVMAEMEGPGCIWRIWSATAEKGHVKIYLDGQETPAVDLPFAEVLQRRHGPVQLPDALVQSGNDGLQRSGPLLADPLPEVVQDRGRQGLGGLLPFHLRHVSQRDEGADVQRRLGRRERRGAEESQRFLPTTTWARIRPATARARKACARR